MKEILNSIWNEYMYGGHVLALGAVSIIFSSSILLGIKITWDFLLIVYLGVYSVYLYNRYSELEKDLATNTESVQYLKESYIKYTPFIFIINIFIILAMQIFLDKKETLSISLLMLLLGILYTFYFKNFTKKIFGFKSFFVPLMWASLIIFCSIYYSFSLNYSLLLIFIFIFLRLFIGTTFADIKDIESDKNNGLKTFPIILGKNNNFTFLKILNILVIFPILVGVYLKLLPLLTLALLLTSVFKYYCINRAKTPNANIADITRKFDYQENVLWSFYILIGFLLIKLL